MKRINILLSIIFIYKIFFYCNASSSFYCGLQEGIKNEFKIKKQDLHIFDSVEKLKKYMKEKEEHHYHDHENKNYKYIASYFKDDQDFKLRKNDDIHSKHWHKNKSIVIENYKGENCDQKHILYDNENHDEKHGKPICITNCIKESFHVERYKKKLICLPCKKENAIWCHKKNTKKEGISICSFK